MFHCDARSLENITSVEESQNAGCTISFAIFSWKVSFGSGPYQATKPLATHKRGVLRLHIIYQNAPYFLEICESHQIHPPQLTRNQTACSILCLLYMASEGIDTNIIKWGGSDGTKKFETHRAHVFLYNSVKHTQTLKHFPR